MKQLKALFFIVTVSLPCGFLYAAGAGEYNRKLDLAVQYAGEKQYQEAGEAFFSLVDDAEDEDRGLLLYNAGTSYLQAFLNPQGGEEGEEADPELLDRAVDLLRSAYAVTPRDEVIYNLEIALTYRQMNQEQNGEEGGDQDSQGENSDQDSDGSGTKQQLEDMISRQQDLNDRNPAGTGGSQSPEEMQSQASQQDELAKESEQLQADSEDQGVQETLKKAQQLQEEASDELAAGNPEAAGEKQEDALDALQQALELQQQSENEEGQQETPGEDEASQQARSLIEQEEQRSTSNLWTEGNIYGVQKDW